MIKELTEESTAEHLTAPLFHKQYEQTQGNTDGTDSTDRSNWLQKNSLLKKSQKKTTKVSTLSCLPIFQIHHFGPSDFRWGILPHSGGGRKVLPDEKWDQATKTDAAVTICEETKDALIKQGRGVLGQLHNKVGFTIACLCLIQQHICN